MSKEENAANNTNMLSVYSANVAKFGYGPYFACKTIAEFPVTDPANMDAWNMQAIARHAIKDDIEPPAIANKAEVEPVAWMTPSDWKKEPLATADVSVANAWRRDNREVTPLFATPPATTGASTVLTDERIAAIWHETACAEGEGTREHPAVFARAIEREVEAQAGQVAVPEDRQTLVNEALSAARELGDCEYEHAANLHKGGPGVKGKVFKAEERVVAAVNALAAAPSAPAVAQQAPAQAEPAPAAAQFIGKVMEKFSALPALFPDGCQEPGALLRHSDVLRILVEASKEAAQASTTGERQEGGAA